MNERRRIPLALDAAEAGTLLGAIAWVLGALQIMRDRGHAEQDEAFHALYEELRPRLDALLDRVGAARAGAGSDEALQRAVEEAYQPVRRAFEEWIRLTAGDTFSVALGQRLAQRLDDEDDDAGAAAGPDAPRGGPAARRATQRADRRGSASPSAAAGRARSCGW